MSLKLNSQWFKAKALYLLFIWIYKAYIPTMDQEQQKQLILQQMLRQQQAAGGHPLLTQQMMSGAGFG